MSDKVKKITNITSLFELVVLQKIYDAKQTAKKPIQCKGRPEILCDGFGQMIYELQATTGFTNS